MYIYFKVPDLATIMKASVVLIILLAAPLGSRSQDPRCTTITQIATDGSGDLWGDCQSEWQGQRFCYCRSGCDGPSSQNLRGFRLCFNCCQFRPAPLPERR